MMRTLCWFLAIYVLYELVAMVQDATEAITGLFVAAIATALVMAAWRSASIDVQMRWRYLSHLAKIPVNMLRDSIGVLWWIAQSLTGKTHLEGYFMRLPFKLPQELDPHDRGRGALAIYGISAAPNSIVADVDARGELVIHKLYASEQPASSPEWPL
ncbi:MAG TPA: hypothetical protein VFL13_10790 [Candidatus Baltobacteraceae bacterium]|nr:hypothetical protein [Candidatus Baltobacteraceae bacterium]